MNFEIMVLPGDGIGPEVVGEALRVLREVGKIYGHVFISPKILLAEHPLIVMVVHFVVRAMGPAPAELPLRQRSPR